MAIEREASVSSLSGYGAIVRRRWKLLVAIVPSSVLLAVFIAYIIQPQYQASATILLEASSIPQELVKTTVVSYADQQIELVQRTVMTQERLAAVVEEVDPYPGLDVSAREKAGMIIDDTSIEKVDPITLKPLPESSAFSIYYLNPDPEIARDVARSIAHLFLTYNVETRTGQAREAYAFLSVRAKEVESQMRELEQQLSDFKQRHGDALPENRTRNEISVDRTQRDLDSAEAEIRLLEQQEQVLKLQLSQVNPMLVAATADSFTQITSVRAELAAAQQKYTPDHPDVKRLTRALEALAEQARSGQSSNVRPDNPEYLRISSELASVRRNLSALRTNASRAMAQLRDYERRLVASPTVERDYVRLERERDILQTQFTDLQNKLREAQVAQTLESEAKGERYTMIRSPYVPQSPFSPNRIGIMLLGFVIGLGVAVALAIMREGADPTIRSMDDLSLMGDVEVMGAIPVLLNEADRRKRRFNWGLTAAAYSAMILVVGLTVFNAVHN